MLTRRHFISTSTAMFSLPIAGPALASSWPTTGQKASWDSQVTPSNYDPATSNPWGLHPRFLPQRVAAKDGLVPGDIHVDSFKLSINVLHVLWVEYNLFYAQISVFE